MRCKRLLAFGLAFLLSFACLSGGYARADDAPALTLDDLTGVSVTMENRIEGNSNLLIPSVAGHPDAEMQRGINERIAERLQLPELSQILERAKNWSGDESADSGIHAEGSAETVGWLMSVVVSIRGELPGGNIGHMYASCNVDLLTGREVTLADLFDQPEEAIGQMEALALDALEREGLNAYLERAEISPLPRDSFSIDARGLTVYYPGEQYRLIDGECGAFFFPYYQIERFMKQSPLTETLLAQRPSPADPAGQVREDIAAGTLPGIPARLGAPMGEYIDRYRLFAEPDYTLDGPLYQFEDPRMQGVKLSSAMYPEDPEDTSEAVINIRATLIDLYGLRPGQSTLLDVADLLGPADEVTEVDAETASDMLLNVGKSFWYGRQGNRLEMHGDEAGVLSAVILHAGD